MIKLFNYDCLDFIRSQDFLELTRGKKLVIVTDPPFNIGYHYNSYDDNKSEGEYYEWLEEIIGITPAVVIHYPEALYKLAFQIGRFPERVVSWVYNSNTAKQHRDVAFFGITPNFKQVTQPYKNPTDKRIMERILNGREGGALYDWWEINQVKNISKEKTIHPCQMPIRVMQNIIGILPKMDDLVVFDPFLGSGTTAIACIENNIDFIGTEVDKTYFEAAEDRINTYTAQVSIWNMEVTNE